MSITCAIPIILSLSEKSRLPSRVSRLKRLLSLLRDFIAIPPARSETLNPKYVDETTSYIQEQIGSRKYHIVVFLQAK
jgi:hypothetical protein